jgi:hypothetical protein
LEEVIAVSENPPSGATPDNPDGPGGDLGPGDASPSDGAGLTTSAIAGRIADQARRTASAAKARRVVTDDGEPGVLDLTPMRELLTELMDELGKLRLRDRIARALRQAADIIDPQTPDP